MYKRIATILFTTLLLTPPTALPATTVTISNTETRRDTRGDILNAHDGCLRKFGDRNYLYGTAYGKTDDFTKANRYRCYSSADLVAWKDEGELLKDPSAGGYIWMGDRWALGRTG